MREERFALDADCERGWIVISN